MACICDFFKGIWGREKKKKKKKSTVAAKSDEKVEKVVTTSSAIQKGDLGDPTKNAMENKSKESAGFLVKNYEVEDENLRCRRKEDLKNFKRTFLAEPPVARKPTEDKFLPDRKQKKFEDSCRQFSGRRATRSLLLPMTLEQNLHNNLKKNSLDVDLSLYSSRKQKDPEASVTVDAPCEPEDSQPVLPAAWCIDLSSILSNLHDTKESVSESLTFPSEDTEAIFLKNMKNCVQEEDEYLEQCKGILAKDERESEKQKLEKISKLLKKEQ